MVGNVYMKKGNVLVESSNIHNYGGCWTEMHFFNQTQ